jgi:hypothetical protein
MRRRTLAPSGLRTVNSKLSLYKRSTAKNRSVGKVPQPATKHRYW